MNTPNIAFSSEMCEITVCMFS